jgi:membrane associated rhomboid family serine protease
MIPLNDENPTRITPIITYFLIVVNVVIFLYELTLNSNQLNAFFDTYAVVPRQLTLALSSYFVDRSFPELTTLITSQFLHGSFLHVGFNMLFLWIFGNNIEDVLGHWKFTIFYLACGILAALTQWYFTMDSAIPNIGASGAIAGVMGAYIIKFPKARVLTLVPLGFLITPVRIPAVFFLGFWFVQQAFNSIASLEANAHIGMAEGGVAYWAHAGGFVFGILLGAIFGLFADRDRR